MLKERLQKDIKVAMSKIVMNDLRNENYDNMISVTDVKITPDLRFAKIFVSIYGNKKFETLEKLNKSNKYIRGLLSKNVKMRNTPNLEFVIDDSMEYGEKMDRLINSLK